MNAKARGLGKGLGALIPSPSSSPISDAAYRELPLSQIEVNPQQPRRHFDSDALTALATSISAVGVLQPIVVRPAGTSDRFEIIAGERRWRAAQLADIPTIPVVVKDSDDESSLVNAIVENTQREDLSPLEEAAAYQQLIDDFGLTHAQVGERLGKNRATVTNFLRLLGLPALVQRLLNERSITAGHARALLGTSDESLQESLAASAAEQQWSVRATEQAVKIATSGSATSRTSKPAKPAKSSSQESQVTAPVGVIEAQAQLEELLSTQVKVTLGEKSGQIQIRFADLTDLDRICTIINNFAPSSST